jgi:hypothetical protein
MTNLLAQAINCDDPDRAAKMIQNALGIESDDIASRRLGRLIASGALASSARGSNRGALSGLVTEPRRFPPPWSAEETDACFIVGDANRQALAYVYFEDEPGRRAAAHILTRDEARRIAANIAKLPGLARKA